MSIKSGDIFVAAVKLIHVRAFGLISSVKRTSFQKFHQCVVATAGFTKVCNVFVAIFNKVFGNKTAEQAPNCPSTATRWNCGRAHYLTFVQRFELTPFIRRVFPFLSIHRRPIVQSVKQVKVKTQQSSFVLAIE